MTTNWGVEFQNFEVDLFVKKRPFMCVLQKGKSISKKNNRITSVLLRIAW